MSEENVEIVRQGAEAFERGDLSQFLEMMSDDLVAYRGEPFGDTFQGKEGFLEMTADWVEGFAEWSVTADEFIDAGDHVIVRLPQEGRGEISGAPVIGVFWFVVTLRGGKVTRVGVFARKDEALEAAGLSE